jgi:hypothetical protein
MTVPFPRMVSLIKVGDLGEEGTWVFCQWVEPDPIYNNRSDLMRWSAFSRLHMNFVDTHVEKGASSEHAEKSQNQKSPAQIRHTGVQHIVSETNVKGECWNGPFTIKRDEGRQNEGRQDRIFIIVKDEQRRYADGSRLFAEVAGDSIERIHIVISILFAASIGMKSWGKP